MYEHKIKTPSVNKTFLKSIFKNSITHEISQVQIDGKALVTIILELNKKNLEEITEVSNYEIYINDEEFEFTWMGTFKYKFTNNTNQQSNCFLPHNEEMKFVFMTPKKGLIEVNKINVNIYPKNTQEKPFVINNILNGINIEVV
jgi:hypothetical protein